MAQSKSRRAADRRTDMSVVNPHAAGIDVGAQFHVVAVGPECTPEPVRSFRSFTTDLHERARWPRQVKVTTYGFDVLLVNAREAKSVPGRKTDVNDAQWLPKLHRYGLLRASFRPRQDVATLRSYLRQREGLLKIRRVPHPAHAEGTDADGRTTASCRSGHHRCHRHEDHPGHRGR